MTDRADSDSNLIGIVQTTIAEPKSAHPHLSRILGKIILVSGDFLTELKGLREFFDRRQAFIRVELGYIRYLRELKTCPFLRFLR